ncbi:MAG: hypothetical protein ACPG8O_10395, partial [Alcanivorax nanhaiticus]
MSEQKIIRLGELEFGNDKPMALFGGMNVLESRDLAMQVALPELDGRLMARIGGFKELATRDDALQCAI